MDVFRFGCCGPLVADGNWYYGARHTPANVCDDGDQLRLVADVVPSGGYTSAQVRTPPFVYGRVTVMARMPAGRGMWPALWLLNAPYHRPGKRGRNCRACGAIVAKRRKAEARAKRLGPTAA